MWILNDFKRNPHREQGRDFRLQENHEAMMETLTYSETPQEIQKTYRISQGRNWR